MRPVRITGYACGLGAISRLFALVSCLTLGAAGNDVIAGAYIFSNSVGPNIVTHPPGYDGNGGTVTVRVCIDPASENASAMVHAVQNNIDVYNNLLPTTGNVKQGSNNDVPSGAIDFESVALHEIGHCLGMDHVNLASESGLSGGNQNYTRTTTGADNSFDLGAGADGVRGSSDDARGDDINLFWFRILNNDPFTIDSVVDATTYSRYLADLPAGHAFPANPDRAVSTLLGHVKTEGVMQQGTFYDEAQRTLGHDDVATLRYASSGVDEHESGGPAGKYADDNYNIVLEYGGIANDASCDINMTFSNTASLAFCSTGGAYVGNRGQHVVVTNASIEFGNGYNWYFTSANSAPVIDQVSDRSLTELDIVSIDIAATDPDADALVFSSSALPAYAQLVDNGDNTASLFLAPALGDAGQAAITITVSEDQAAPLSDATSFSIDVAALDSDGDGLSDFDEITIYGTLPGDTDSDNDGIGDGEEVAYATDPLDGDSWPIFADGDVAPLGRPDGTVNAADLVVMQRIVLGVVPASSLELAHGDLYPPSAQDGVIDLSDLILLRQQLTP